LGDIVCEAGTLQIDFPKSMKTEGKKRMKAEPQSNFETEYMT
jgi:hypothetical protein